MKDILDNIGNIPITSSVLASLYPHVKDINHKLSQMEQTGILIRLKQGLYVVNPQSSGLLLSTELIANHLYGPSFVSQSTALRYYGLIPERVVLTQSMTIKRSHQFNTAIGQFDYTYVSRKSFSVGVRVEQQDKCSFLIATPERALCDLVANTSNLNLRSQKETAQYLFEDIRLDEDAFFQMNQQVFEQYIQVGKKSKSIQSILNLLQS